MSGFHDWEARERVFDRGGVESRQHVLVSQPAVEPSGDDARSLGVTYWCAVDSFTHGVIRATRGDEGGRLRLFGGATLLRFGPPELPYTNERIVRGRAT